MSNNSNSSKTSSSGQSENQFNSVLGILLTHMTNIYLPESMINFQLVNKKINDVIKQHRSFWQNKLKIHFPNEYQLIEKKHNNQFNEVCEQDPQFWYSNFWNTYRNTYQFLKNKIKSSTVFSIAKERKLKEFIDFIDPLDLLLELEVKNNSENSLMTPLTYDIPSKEIYSKTLKKFEINQQLPQLLINSKKTCLEKIDSIVILLKLNLLCYQIADFIKYLKESFEVLTAIDSFDLLENIIPIGTKLDFTREDISKALDEGIDLRIIIFIEMIKKIFLYLLYIMDADYFKLILITEYNFELMNVSNDITQRLLIQAVNTNSFNNSNTNIFNKIFHFIYVNAIVSSKITWVEKLGQQPKTELLRFVTKMPPLSQSIFHWQEDYIYQRDKHIQNELYSPIHLAVLTGNLEIYRSVKKNCLYYFEEDFQWSELTSLEIALKSNYMELTKEITLEIISKIKQIDLNERIVSNAQIMISALPMIYKYCAVNPEYIVYLQQIAETLYSKFGVSTYLKLICSYNQIYLLCGAIKTDDKKFLKALFPENFIKNESPFLHFFLNLENKIEQIKFLTSFLENNRLEQQTVLQYGTNTYEEEYQLSLVEGDNIAHIAARQKDLVLLQWLYEKSPNLFLLQNKNGQTVLDLCHSFKLRVFVFPKKASRKLSQKKLYSQPLTYELCHDKKFIFLDHEENSALHLLLQNHEISEEKLKQRLFIAEKLRQIINVFIKELNWTAEQYKAFLMLKNNKGVNVLEMLLKMQIDFSFVDRMSFVFLDLCIRAIVPQDLLKETSLVIYPAEGTTLLIKVIKIFMHNSIFESVINYVAECTSDFDRVDHFNKTPFYYLLSGMGSNEEAINWFIKKYNELKRAPAGLSPLFAIFFCYRDNPQIIKALEEINCLELLDWSAYLSENISFKPNYFVPINKIDRDKKIQAIVGDNLAHLAARVKNIECLKWLVENKPFEIFYHKNSEGQTVWDLCKENNISLNALTSSSNHPTSSEQPGNQEEIRELIKKILHKDDYWHKQVRFSFFDKQPASIKAMKKLVAGNENFDFNELAKQIKPPGLKSYFFRKKETQQFYDFIQTIAICYNVNNSKFYINLLQSFLNLTEPKKRTCASLSQVNK